MIHNACLRARCLTATALLTIFGCLSSPVFATTSSPESARYAEQADIASRKGDVATAIIQLKNAIRSDSSNLAARTALAQLYLQSNQPAAAEQELETAKSRGYDETKILVPLADAYFAQGKFRDVVAKLDGAKLQGEARGNLLAIQARAHLALQEAGKARAVLDGAIAATPDLPSVLMANALLLRGENKYAEAETQVDKALAKMPRHAEFLLLKGELRAARNDNAGSAKIFDDVVKFYPKLTRAYVARAMARLGRNETAGVAEDVAYVLAQEPENLLGVYMQAYLLAHDNKPKEAVHILAAHTQLLASYAPANYLLASAALADNRTEMALAYAKRYREKAPNDPFGIRLMAAVQQRAGNANEAVGLLEPLAAKSPSDNQVRLQLANAYLAVGRSDQAIRLFQQGVAADPTNTDAQFALAVSQINSGDKDQGAAQLEQLLKANPTYLQGNAVMVMMSLQDGAIDRALKTVDAMIAANADDPNAYNLQGTVYLAAQKPDQAAASFKTALAKDPKFGAAALNLARAAERRSDREDARRWYEKTLSIDPANVAAYEGLANLALMNNGVNEAAKQFEQAIKYNPEAAEPRLRLIDLLLQAKDNQRALIVARNFANAQPDDVKALEALGRAQIITGDYTNGIASYRRVVAKAPDNVEAERRLAGALNQAARSKFGNPAVLRNEARALLDQVIAAAPEYQPALADRIALEREVQGPDAALAVATKLSADRPQSAVRLMTLGDTELAVNRADEAIGSYRRAYERAKTQATVHHLYNGLIRAKRVDEGVQVLKSWVTANPKDHDTRFLLASYYIDAGKLDDAIRETEAIKVAAPDNPVLLNNLAWLYGQKGNPKAIEVGERAYWLAPTSPDVMDTLGSLYIARGETAKGIALLGQAHDRAPERADIGYRYAAALEKAGEATKAKGVLQKTLTTKAAFGERTQAEAMLKRLGG